MQVVAKVWYHLYWGWIMLFCGGIGLVWGGARFVPQLVPVRDHLVITTIILAMSGTVVAYGLTLHWVIARYDRVMAMFGAAMLYTFVTLGGLTLAHNTQGVWVYAAGWFVGVFFTGMFSAPILMGTVFLSGIFVLLETHFQVPSLSPPDGMILIGTGVGVIVSYLFWRGRFNNPINRELSQISGLLHNKEEQAAILIQSIADGVIVTNTEGKISVINHTAANMTGWNIEDAIGINVQSVFKAAKENGADIPADEYPFNAVLIHKAFYNQTLQLTSRSGKKQMISLVISPVVTATGEVYGTVAVLRDVSEQRAAEQQRAEFISTASHEMRTPVAAIEGYLALTLNDKVSTIDSRARSYLEKAHSSTQHLGHLFQDLLTSAKAEDGRLSNHPTVVEMGSFLEQLVEDLRFGAQKKGLNSEFVIGSGNAVDATSKAEEAIKMVRPLYYVYADPDRMREVVTNLFDNAVKYTEQGKVSLGLTGNAEVVQIYIRDTGAGIPPEDVPHLFQKFYRVDNSATRTIGGTGLGLFIARKIIELYQGRIWVGSEMGKGSTFFIDLPRLSSQKAQDLVNAAAALPAAAPNAPATQPAAAPPTPAAQGQ